MDIPEIDVPTAAARLTAGDALFLDVRDPASFSAAHVPGAVLGTDENIEEFVEDTPKDKPIVVYCYHGNNSRGGTAFLLQKGFTDVCSMSGGFEAWRGQFPEERG